MKKTLVSMAALLMTLPVMAAENCAYSPLQNLIRNVRSVNEVNKLIQQGVQFSEEVRCGGSLTQLAVLRGNADVLQAILNQDRARANAEVSLQSYRIDGAPSRVPLILFAAYYAPNEQMIYKLIEAGADISKTDDSGRNLLWYMDQNPVLRNTDLYDRLNNMMLEALIRSQQKQPVYQFSNLQQQQPQQPKIPAQLQPKGPAVVDVASE